ncbi:MAG: hypothetical protein FWD58_00535 [Firmicutes bacterium]|nr:hypothetical protein [Bacillota bacterium]
MQKRQSISIAGQVAFAVVNLALVGNSTLLSFFVSPVDFFWYITYALVAWFPLSFGIAALYHACTAPNRELYALAELRLKKAKWFNVYALVGNIIISVTWIPWIIVSSVVVTLL